METMTTPAANASGNLQVEIRRVIRASRQRVYEAWTRPEEIHRWFGPGAIRVTDAETDARQGGAYRIVMKGSIDGTPEHSERVMPVEGVYQELVPFERIRFTWKPAWASEEESLVTIRLKDVEGGTELVLIHEQFTQTESRDGHARGWAGSLDKLERYLQQ